VAVAYEREAEMRLLVCCCLVLLLVTQASALEMRDKTLPNGLRVVVAENHNAPVFTMRVYVRAGSDYESEYLGSGISHLMEHLLAGGTTNLRSEADSKRILTAIGGAHNAYTSRAHACYFIETSVEFADSVLSLLPDWMLNNAIAPAEFDREKGVITREIQMGRDEPGRRLDKLYNGTEFTIHPEHYPTIGYPEIFEKLTRDDVVRHYTRMYVPANMFAVAVGDFDADEMMAKIAEVFSKYPYQRPFTQVLPSDPKQMGRRYAEEEMDIDQTYITMGFRTCLITNDDTYPLQVLAHILGDGRSSRLYREVKEKLGLVYTIGASSYNAEYDASDFTVNMTCDYDKAGAATDAAVGVLYNLRHSFVTKAELDKARTQIASDYAFGFQSVEDQASTIGQDLMRTGNPNYQEFFLKKIEAVTKEDIKRVANKYFYDDALTIGVLRPSGAVPPKPAAQVMAQAVPPVTKTVLENGITLLQKGDRNAPLVHIRAYFRGGSYLENSQTNGAFNLMARMMRRGTRTRSADEIARELDAMGGSLALGANEDYFYCTMDCLSDKFDRGLALLTDIMMNSTFGEDQVEKEREVVLAQILERSDDWQADSEAKLRKLLYGDHPYALDPLGEEASVKSVGASQLRDLYLKYVTPKNMVLAVFGDVDKAYAGAAVAKDLGRFDRRGAELPPLQIWAGLDRDLFETLPTSKEQAVIFMGYPGMDLGSPDWYAMRVLDAVTSGIGYPGGWLHETLRGQKLVYIVHAWNYALPERGYFAVMAATSPATADSALKIMREKMEQAKSEYVTDQELAMGKRICNIMEDVYYSQTSSAQADLAAQYEVLGLGYNYRDGMRDKINAVTKEDVRMVAQKYLTHSATILVEPETK
jgi:zinc protease